MKLTLNMFALSLALSSICGFAGETLKREASSIYSLNVISNVKNINIMKDGLLMGHANDPMDIQKGIFELSVNANGYVPRLVKINIDGRNKSIDLNINLAKYGKDGLEVDGTYDPVRIFELNSRLNNLPSICQIVGPSLKNSSLVCNRQTLEDDVHFARLSWQQGSTSPKYAKPLFDQLHADAGKLSSDDFYWNAETIYSANPNDPIAANFLAYSSLLRDDCARVYQIGYENSGYGAVTPDLYLMNGLCKEMEGKPEVATAYYQKALLNANAPNELYFHALRLLFSLGQQASGKKHLNKCLSNGMYYPCWELSAYYYLLTGNEKKAVKLIKVFRKRTRETVVKLFVKQLSILEPKDKKRAELIASSYKSNPYSYEIAWHHIFGLDNTPSLSLATIFGSDAQITSSKMSKSILRKAKKSKNPRLTLLALKPFQQRWPDSNFFWEQLADSYKKQNKCDELKSILEGAIKSKTGKKAKRSDFSFNTKLGECYLFNNDYIKCANIFKRLVKSYPSRWRTHYNYGAVLERLKQPKKAVAEFKKALKLNPPSNYKTVLEDKIYYYSPKK